MKARITDVDVEFLHQTEKAYKVRGGPKDAEIWLPKSCGCQFSEEEAGEHNIADEDLQEGGLYMLTLSEHLATEKGLV